MLKILKVAAVVGALAWASPERGPAAFEPPALDGRAAEALWQALPEGARERLLREAARSALDAPEPRGR
jgi:hypothetical protein